MWRKTDTRYALATLAALAAVTYLVAGNFGLVPTPIAAFDRGELPQVAVPLTDTQPVSSTTVSGGSPNPLLETIVRGRIEGPPPRPPGGPTTPARDTTPPTSGISTEDGAVLVEEPVVGTAADAGSGVGEVRVSFTLVGAVPQPPVSARLDCDDAMRSCIWRADPPLTAGTYRVTVEAEDRAGNVEVPGPDPITVTVVTTGGIGTSTDSDDDGLLEDLRRTTGSVLRTSGSLISGTAGVLAGLLGL